MSKQSRKAFEKWAQDKPFSLDKNIAGFYASEKTHYAFKAYNEGYQAALATRPDVNQELVEALERILNRAMVHDQEFYEEVAKQALAKHKAGESAGFTEDRLEEL